MPQFENVELTEKCINEMAHWLDHKNSVFPFSDNDNSALLICYMLTKQIGGPNDDLARFIYDIDHKKKIDRKNLITQIGITEGGTQPSVRITCHGSGRLTLTIPDLCEIVECRDDGLIISPVSIAAYIRSHRLMPVFVKEWAKQVIFSDFNIKTEPLANQLWVLRNNEALLYSRIVSNHQIVFQGMHDIVGHIAGLTYDGFEFAAEAAKLVLNKLTIYFGGKEKGNLPSHLIPFLVGILLDELTQKPFYFSESRAQAISELLESLDEGRINPQELLILKSFPVQLNDIMEIARNQSDFSLEVLRKKIRDLYHECRNLIVSDELEVGENKAN